MTTVSEESLMELPGGAKAVTAEEEEEGNEDEMTVCERAVILGLMTSVSFSSNLTVSLVLPFLPQELDSMDLPGQQLTGLVFAVFPLMILLLSPLCNLLAKRVGRVPLLYAGVPLQVVAVVLFGLAVSICGPGWPAVALFLASRATQGFGAALANLAIFSIIAETFPRSLGKVMGFNEVIIGVGFMMGPVAGSLLYTTGGFALPFLAASGVVALSFPFVVAYHRLEFEGSPGSATSRGRSSSTQGGPSREEEATFLQQIWGVLTWRVQLTALILFLGTGAFGWVETILSLHLQNDLMVKDKFIGIIFAVINVTYSSFGPFVGALADAKGYHSIMVAGFVLTSVTFVLMGPLSAPVAALLGGGSLQFRRVWEICLLGCFGCSQSLCMIPTLPAMKTSASKGKLSQQDINNVVCVFNQAQQSGLMFSPPLSGLLSPALGFSATMGIYGVVCLSIGLLSGSMFRAYGVQENGSHCDSDSLDPFGASQPLLIPEASRKASDLSSPLMGSVHRSLSRSNSLRSPTISTMLEERLFAKTEEKATKTHR